jgi:chitinase
MIPASVRLIALCGSILFLPGGLAGFDSGVTNNIAIYWGQNSVNKVGGQERLAAYCSSESLSLNPPL